MKLKISVLSVLSACVASMASSQTTHITQGGNYVLSTNNSNPAAPCVSVETQEPVTISGWFYSAGDGIDALMGGNITVKNARFFATGPEAKENGTAINISHAKTVGITNCSMTGFNAGVWVDGTNTSDPVVYICSNLIKNPRGPACRAIQLIDCLGITGSVWANEVEHNGSAQAGDSINLFHVQGSQGNRFSVQMNLVNGSIEHDPTQQASNAGITTDGYQPQQLICRYIDIDNNTVVHATNCITLAYGCDCEASGNTAVSDNIMANGQLYPFYAYGMGVYRGAKTDVLKNNQIAFTSAYGRTDLPGPGIGTFKGNTALWAGQVVTKEMEQWAVNQWREMIHREGIVIGPQ